MTVDRIAAKVRAGGRVDAGEALDLYRAAPTPLLGRLADEIRGGGRGQPGVAVILSRGWR